MSEYDVALAATNNLKMQLAQLVQIVVASLADDAINIDEGVSIGMQAMLLGMTMKTMLRSYTKDEQAHILYVLKHGQIVLPVEASLRPTGPVG